MADLSIKFDIDDLRTIAFGAVGAGYTAIGNSSDYPIVQFIVQNFTDVDLLFSIDGINDKFRLPADGFWNCDVAANKQGDKSAALPVGTTFYVKQDGVPASGSVDVVLCYLR